MCPYWKYGLPALRDSLIALPARPRRHDFPYLPQLPTDDRNRIESAIVDDWAVELFRYCRRCSSPGLRMVAMLTDAQEHLNDAYARVGIEPTDAAMDRVRSWQRLAARFDTT